jgi:broad specificity phosphatase PhoE
MKPAAAGQFHGGLATAKSGRRIEQQFQQFDQHRTRCLAPRVNQTLLKCRVANKGAWPKSLIKRETGIAGLATGRHVRLGLQREGRQCNVVSHGITGSIIRGVYAGVSVEEMLRLPVPQDSFSVLSNGRISQVDELHSVPSGNSVG